jgi:hypothetical protein
MAANIGAFEIIHARPPEIAVCEQKAARLDHIYPHPQAGPQPHQATRILRNIGLIQCQAHQILRDQPDQPNLSRGRTRHFLRHRAARPSKSDSLFYRPNEQAAGPKKGAGRVTASVPSPQLFVARVRAFLFCISRFEGEPSGSYDT